MSSTKFGLMIVLSSPSGAGKTTLVKLLSKRDNYFVSISHTTRKPRENEKNGRDYFFVSNNDFEKSIKNSEFFEVLVPYEYFNFGLKESIKVEKGLAILPNKPGLGIELDWDFIDNSTFKKY